MGYQKAETTCEDVDECEQQSHLCHALATCINTSGSYNCQCVKGYKGTGRECQNVDECSDSNLNRCGNNAECVDTVGSYDCKCNIGYENKAPGIGMDCRDVNECTKSDQILKCDSDLAKCINTEGSYECKCIHGYDGDGVQCHDIDECDATAGPGIHELSSHNLRTIRFTWLTLFGPLIPDKDLQRVVQVVFASTLKALSPVNVLLAMLFKESFVMISTNAVCSLIIATLTPIAPIQMEVIHVCVISAILPSVMAKMKMVVWTLMNAQPLTTHVTRTQNALTQRAAMTAIVKMDLLVMVCTALISTNAK